MNPPEKIRLLVIETNASQQELFRSCCRLISDVSVELVVPNGRIALQKIETEQFDIILLDYNITDIALIDFTKKALRQCPDIGILLTVPENDPIAAQKAIEVLAAGSFDFVFKPSPNEADGFTVLQRRVLPKIRIFSIRRYSHRARGTTAPPTQQYPTHDGKREAIQRLNQTVEHSSNKKESVEIILLGVSTGGPEALLSILPQFPAAFPLPVVIVIHMPKLFTRPMAEALSTASLIDVTEAIDNQELLPGHAYLAPGGTHLEIRRGTRNRLISHLSNAPPENGCRPAVDVLFRSAAKAVGGRTIAAILTGMGTDGTKGASMLGEKGAYIIAQNEASSLVWGMPGSVVRAGTANLVLPLDEIVPAIVKRVSSL